MPGAVAVTGGRAILTEPTAQPQPIAAPISALVPVNESPVPATQQTGWLARLLPIPDAANQVRAEKFSLDSARFFCDTPPRVLFFPGDLCKGVMP